MNDVCIIILSLAFFVLIIICIIILFVGRKVVLVLTASSGRLVCSTTRTALFELHLDIFQVFESIHLITQINLAILNWFTFTV